MPIVNVYKEKEMQNAYIGEYKKPSAVLDVDFRTLSNLNDFTVSSNGGTQLNQTNGLSRYSTSSDRILQIWHSLPGDISDATKITMSIELYGNYRSWGLGQYYGLVNDDNSKNLGESITFNNNGTSYMTSGFSITGVTLASITQANPTGWYTSSFDVDLTTGEFNCGYSGPANFSGNGILTSAQIDEIRQYTRVFADIRGQGSAYNWLRKLNLTIDY